MLHVEGIVVHGEKRGRVLGYPTANIEMQKKKLHITSGIFAGWAFVGKNKYKAGIFIPASLDRVEAHLLDYPGDSLYGLNLELEIIQKVSEVETYTTDQELIKKISNDIEMVRHILE